MTLHNAPNESMRKQRRPNTSTFRKRRKSSMMVAHAYARFLENRIKLMDQAKHTLATVGKGFDHDRDIAQQKINKLRQVS